MEKIDRRKGRKDDEEELDVWEDGAMLWMDRMKKEVDLFVCLLLFSLHFALDRCTHAYLSIYLR